jgi:hypothetical protein
MTISFTEFMEITEPELVNDNGYVFRPLRPSMVLKDGTVLSVQASETHYCEPRENDGPYTAVEIGFPKQSISEGSVMIKQVLIDELMPFAEPSGDGYSGVFGWVPVEVLEQVITGRGGIVGTSEGMRFVVVGEKLF